MGVSLLSFKSFPKPSERFHFPNRTPPHTHTTKTLLSFMLLYTETPGLHAQPWRSTHCWSWAHKLLFHAHSRRWSSVHLRAKDQAACQQSLLRSPLQGQLEEVGKTSSNEADHLQTWRALGSVEQKDALWEKTGRGYSETIERAERSQWLSESLSNPSPEILSWKQCQAQSQVRGARPPLLRTAPTLMYVEGNSRSYCIAYNTLNMLQI